ncbi:MAG: alpha-hydroxy acid oxidase [Cytophagales bacterium]|nr:alpha-hydroxy acid oxidase [Cytophagales bacterium]
MPHPNHEHRRLLLKFLLSSPLLSFTGCTTPQEKEAIAEEIVYSLGSASDAINVFDFERMAKEKLPVAHYGYLATGVNDDLTLQANRDAMAKVKLRMRRLVAPGEPDMSVELFGKKYPTPLIICPVGSQRAFHPDGEIAVARAAKVRNHLQALSTVSTTSIEEVTKERGAPVVYQLYALNNWKATQEMIRRAEDAGSEVMAFTVDLAAGTGNRETLERFTRIDTRQCSNCHTSNRFARKPMVPPIEGIEFEQKLTWQYVDQLKAFTKMKLVIKGIETSEDAQLCLSHGADGIWVSNHGGRASETGRGTLEALPEIVATVKGKVPVIIDGGFRRGTDIFKALALGANAVGIGRPYIWGLSCFGQEGVEAVLRILSEELKMTMQQAGTSKLDEIDSRFVI